MNSFIRPPNLTYSYAVSADWLELLCLLRDSGTSSEDDLVGPDKILDDHAAIVDFDPTADNEDINIVDPARERALDALFEEIARRQQELGETYPFVANISLRHLRLECADEVDDFILKCGREVYRACLMISACRNGIIDSRSAGIQVDPNAGKLFQICATLAAAGYVCGDAYSFGSPRPDHTPLLKAVELLTCYLKSGQAKHERPIGETKYAKDAGVDIVAWRMHTDQRPAKLIIYGQCASGMNWEGKPVAGKVQRLDGYYVQPPSKHWLPALFLPFPLYMGKENAHELWTETAMKGYYSQIEAEMGLIFDRSRIVTCAVEALRDPQPVVQTEIDRLDVVSEWCEATTRAICDNA